MCCKINIIPYICIKEISATIKTITATKARENLFGLIDETTAESQPIKIIGKHANAILIAEDDWKSIHETFYLLSIHGMRESIVKGLRTPLDKCVSEIKW
ncbi:MAG: type II toxin-antitoxin system Phd/YefM family antitoxin [Ignavibacteriaceae bacterium]